MKLILASTLVALAATKELSHLRILLGEHAMATRFQHNLKAVSQLRRLQPPSSGASFNCDSMPCTAAGLGDVALTTVSGTGGDDNPISFAVGENIYGPFEAGFASAQDFILAGLGCTTGYGYVDGGIDTLTAESVVAKDCNVVMPRWEGDEYVSLLDVCGGHTKEYHFHERLSCLFELSAGHSTQVGEGLVEGDFLYGKWEVYPETLPKLDACGGHFGRTPESPDVDVYHYHVQDKPPFTFGCYGPNEDGGLVTIAECRDRYSECGDGDETTLTVGENDIMGYTDGETIQYDPWCPCFDGEGSNVGNAPLAAFEGGNTSEDEGDVTPEDEGEVTPEDEGEVTPEDEGEVTPEDEGEDSPEDEGEVTPEDEGEVTPEDEGEDSPEDEGEVTPEDEGEVTPEDEGGAKPPAVHGGCCSYPQVCVIRGPPENTRGAMHGGLGGQGHVRVPMGPPENTGVAVHDGCCGHPHVCVPRSL